MSAGYSHMSQSRVIAAYVGDIRFELVKMLRTPAFAVPTLLFPLMFYTLFGVFMGAQRGNGTFALYALAGYGVFGTMAPGLFGFGVSLAFERELGTLTYRQALPMPAVRTCWRAWPRPWCSSPSVRRCCWRSRPPPAMCPSPSGRRCTCSS
jgi:hypothetical protein